MYGKALSPSFISLLHTFIWQTTARDPAPEVSQPASPWRALLRLSQAWNNKINIYTKTSNLFFYLISIGDTHAWAWGCEKPGFWELLSLTLTHISLLVWQRIVSCRSRVTTTTTTIASILIRYINLIVPLLQSSFEFAGRPINSPWASSN